MATQGPSSRRVRGDARGFALVELLVVVALLGVLAVLGYLNFDLLVSRTRAHAAAANLLMVRDGMLRVGVDCGGLPVSASAAGDPGLTTRPSWGQTCWRGPYLNHWPTGPGSYQFDGPGGMQTAVVRVHSLPVEAIQPVAAQVVGLFGPGAVLGYSSATGWSAEIPVGREYRPSQVAAVVPPPAPAPPTAAPGTVLLEAFRSIGGAWTVVAGRLQGSGTSMAIADVAGADYTFAVDVQTLTPGKAVSDVARVVVQYKDAQNYYAIVPRSNGVVELGKMQGGKWTSLKSVKKTGIDPTAVHHFEVSVVGAAISVAVDGKALIAYTDKKPVTGGSVGVATSKSTGAFENPTVVPK